MFTTTHDIGLLGAEARVEYSRVNARPLMFLSDGTGRMVLVLSHEMLALRDLLNSLPLATP